MKSNKQKLKKQLDNLWSEYAKARVGYKCEYCGKKEYLNSHHIYSRSNYSTRWEEVNSVCLCSGHHTLCIDFSAHKTPLEFTEWLFKVRSRELLDGLRVMKNHPFKIETSWLEEKIKYFKAKLKDIENEK